VDVIRAHAAGGDWRLAQCGYSAPSLVFYAGREITRCPDRESLGHFFDGQPDGFAVVAAGPDASWDGLLPANAEIIHEQDAFPKAGRVAVIRGTGTGSRRVAISPTSPVRP
jgi:hypothetical protein